jgi:hypothetical protein
VRAAVGEADAERVTAGVVHRTAVECHFHRHARGGAEDAGRHGQGDRSGAALYIGTAEGTGAIFGPGDEVLTVVCLGSSPARQGGERCFERQSVEGCDGGLCCAHGQETEGKEE